MVKNHAVDKQENKGFKSKRMRLMTKLKHSILRVAKRRSLVADQKVKKEERKKEERKIGRRQMCKPLKATHRSSIQKGQD